MAPILRDTVPLYYISAEAERPSLSAFGPTSRRFWLPEQPGSCPEQGGACPERSGSNQGAIRERAGAILEQSRSDSGAHPDHSDSGRHGVK